MNATDRKAIKLAHRQRHIEQLQALGYIYDNMNAIKALEHKANYMQTQDCNGKLRSAANPLHRLGRLYDLSSRGVLTMKTYTVTIRINVQGDDEDHAIEQALELITDGQFTPEVEEKRR